MTCSTALLAVDVASVVMVVVAVGESHTDQGHFRERVDMGDGEYTRNGECTGNGKH